MENGKIAKTIALINSGATICCIDHYFARRMKWPLEKLKRPMYTRNADRTNTSGGMIHYQVDLYLRIDGKDTKQHFFMLNLGKWDNIILGYLWLTWTNPKIDWTTREVSLIGTPIPRHDDLQIVEQRYLLWYLGAMKRDKSEYATQIYAQQRRAAMLREVLGENHPHIWKLTLSTSPVQAVEKVEQKLPPQYAKYAKVFNKPGEGELPPQWPFNHTIDLKDSFVLKVTKTYPMNPTELEVCKEFLDENLKASKIWKSQSPQASPFFFIQKNDGGLQHCQDYRYLNEHMVKNAYPLPLISTLINKLKGANTSPRWTSNGGTTTCE